MDGMGRDGDALTERRSMLSRRCRGSTVTSSMSHKKATSGGPGLGGEAAPCWSLQWSVGIGRRG